MQIKNNQLLRFATAGSVDDGKSTLIGRLLYDSKAIYQDQLENVSHYSKKKGNLDVNLSFFTDGLQEERELGITIDVAYRYFTTTKRKFIVADSPGHLPFTKNMFTAASTANALVIIVDARYGIIEQTKRHTFIASLLKVDHIVLCINKMDLINYEESVYFKIVSDFKDFTKNQHLKNGHVYSYKRFIRR